MALNYLLMFKQFFIEFSHLSYIVTKNILYDRSSKPGIQMEPHPGDF